MILAKPPIVGDVAELVGNYGEKVENRSLLLNKFPVHKRWPVDPYDPDRKWDDASRWSFIRVTENGEFILERELQRRNNRANGRNVSDVNRKKALDEADLLQKMKACACRRLPTSLATMRKEHVGEFVKRFAEHPERHLVVIGKLCGTLAVNLSDSLIQNAGICLDRLFGEPYIPGSSVKGVCRHVGLARLAAGSLSVEQFQQLFGTADVDFGKDGDLAAYAAVVAPEKRNRKGGFDFLAAYPMDDVRVAVDMTNVHYPDYYQSGNEADLAKENPRPNPFPVTAPGVRFAFCIARNGMPCEVTLLEALIGIVREALEKHGLGAKTAAGYGWFDCSETEKWHDERRRIKSERDRKAALVQLENQINTLAAMDAQRPEFRVRLAEIEADAHFGDLPSRAREEVVHQKRRLPQASPLDVLRGQWERSGANAVIGMPVFGRKLNIASADRSKANVDDEMDIVIRLLRESAGIGSEVWSLLKRIADDGNRKNKYKHIPNVVGSIRDLSKNRLQLGKMP